MRGGRVVEPRPSKRDPRLRPADTGSRGRMTSLDGLVDEQFCYLTTIGRVTGRPHTIEIWFALEDVVLYMLAGGGRKSDWVRNLTQRPGVNVRIGATRIGGRARIVTDDDESGRARVLVYSKYQSEYGGDLRSWRDTALPVAVDLDVVTVT